MFGYILKKIIGSKNERELKKIAPIVARINELEKHVEKLKDDELKAYTPRFLEMVDRHMAEAEQKASSIDDEEREKFLQNEREKILDHILPEAFAVVREVAKRTLGERHFDVQLIGGYVLHKGKIAEMKTGEGKTLAATLPVYLNALLKKGVHVVTVNDYLARRDAEWMGVIYRFLGMSVGVIVHDMDDAERKKSYQCDVTYGTNNEFGFDYLRDNMKFSADDFVQRELYYAIVDEVDSILIDEARTPLIISGPAEEVTDKYYTVNRIIPHLKRNMDYTVDEKHRTVVLTEEGVTRVEKLLKVDNLYDPRNIDLLHFVNQALKAHILFKRDVDYIVKDGQVIIVDEFTGRLMPGRRYSDGLHQALEAKENVKVEKENQTLATITFQNYFRMYKKLAGMTGTADTEAVEFKKIYDLDVVVVPTNEPMIRIDYPDVIYRTEKEKFEAVCREIEELHKKGRPVLVGTTSVEKSERLSKMLKRRGIPHEVLNAKNHEKEAEIIAKAGHKGHVTISTNMAGRGTDIKLGPGVAELGGLHVIGTERHESRRIDNQLRGRAGRQGDPGSSRFYLSLEDDLLRIFASDRISNLMQRIGLDKGVPIEHSLVTKAIESAQKRVEAYNFEIRKNLLEYDDVMNKQREVIYAQRKRILTNESMKDEILEITEELIEDAFYEFVDEHTNPVEWNLQGLDDYLYKQFGFKMKKSHKDLQDVDPREFLEEIKEKARRVYEEREKELYERLELLIEEAFPRYVSEDVAPNKWNLRGLNEFLLDRFGFSMDGALPEAGNGSAKELLSAVKERARRVYEERLRKVEKFIMLQAVDNHWKDHLLNMDYLKEGIGLRGYGQVDPLKEYQRESFEMFMDMVKAVKEDAVEKIFKVRQTEEKVEVQRAKKQKMILGRGGTASLGESKPKPVRVGRKIGRNEPCPCGSGKKYKKCCGRTGGRTA